jgi:hypothetical protein
MSSRKQTQANRLNAQKSTGPRSVEGKAASRMNALKTGIDAESLVVPGEDADDLTTLTAEYLESCRPASPQERVQVDILIRADWQLRRLARAEAQLWQDADNDLTERARAFPLGNAYRDYSNVFTRLQRRIDATERSYRLALRELKQLQAVRPATPADAPAEAPLPPPKPIESETNYPSIGFVPHSGLEPLAGISPAPDPASCSPVGQALYQTARSAVTQESSASRTSDSLMGFEM